jgi:homoisocitrate dehydrogenase
MPKLCVMPGDGIGQEVIPAAVAVLQTVIPDLETVYAEAGWDCFLKHGASMPESTLDAIRDCGAGLFGAVSSPSHKVAGYRSAIITLRQALDLYANIRPVQSWPHVSPRPGIDMIIVRENTEGLYSGRERIVDSEQFTVNSGQWTVDSGESDPSSIQNRQSPVVLTAVAERVITRRASLRIAEKTRQIMTSQNRQKLTIVHKANVLPLTDGLFRDCVKEVFNAKTQRGEDAKKETPASSAPPRFKIDELLVDVAALKMLEDPERFDVVVTTNLFGDILSDAASYWGGGLGFAPSLNWGDGIAVAEPVHGSAPDIAGQGIANPIAAILSAALLARYAWGMEEAAGRMETAVFHTLTHQPALTGAQAITQAILNAL